MSRSAGVAGRDGGGGGQSGGDLVREVRAGEDGGWCAGPDVGDDLQRQAQRACSTPLAQTTNGASRSEGAPARRADAAWAPPAGPHRPHRASRTSTRIGSGRRMPGRRGFSRLAAIASARAGSRAHNVTALPARAAWIASAVPQAPAPITATLLIDDPPHCGRFARFPIAKPTEQRVEERRNLLLEAIRRIDHQHAAAIELRRIDRLAKAKFGDDDIAHAALLHVGEELPHRGALLDRIPGCEHTGS